MTFTGSEMDRAVRRLDAWRRAPLAPPTDAGSYKEWMHFCIRLPGEPPGHLVVNMSVTEHSLPSGARRSPRLLALAFTDAWIGHVETFEDSAVRGAAGEIDLELGENSLRWSEGAFYLLLRAGSLRAELRLTPWMLPTAAGSVSLSRMHTLHWIAVPRLSAEGNLTLGGRSLRLSDAAAYHDHNWGHFRWGADLSWEWGFVHPLDSDCPWSLVFLRISDGLRHRTLSQGILVWNGARHVRAFENNDIHIELEGSHAGPRPLTLPGAMSLLVPGAASGVPARVHIRARSRSDTVEVTFCTHSKARIAVPSDLDSHRSVLLNETTGLAQVRGRIGQDDFQFEGSAVVEFVRG